MLHVDDNYDDRDETRLLAEYRELPALRLTAAQAGRLLAIEPRCAQLLLEVLVARGFLRTTPDRRYVSHGSPCQPRQLAGTEAAAWPPAWS
mgnify:CR=1 FL=1